MILTEVFSFMGSKYIDLDTESQAEAKNLKGDRFDARIQLNAIDKGWHRAYNYTRATADQSSYLNPNTRSTSPSTYLHGSRSSSVHTIDQGRAGPSRPPRVATYQPGTIEEMQVADDGQEQVWFGGHSQGHYDGHRSGARESHRSHGHTRPHQKDRSRRSRESSRTSGDDGGCCIIM